MKILIAGFPYIRKNYLETFNHYPHDDELFFLLPNLWKIKKGKYTYHPPEQTNIFKTRALFYHSHYPIIGGLLKGWMPSFPLLLMHKQFDLVYSCSEPILLTTLYQAIWTKLMGLPHVIFSWENIAYEQKLKGFSGLVHRIILKLNLWLCDGIIAGNHKGANIYSTLTKRPIAIIPMNGVDTEFFKPAIIKKKRVFEGLDLSDKIIFSFIGAIGYRKGIQVIVEALSEVLRVLPEAHLVIAGSGEYEAEIATLIDVLDLGAHVTRVAWIDHERLRDLLNMSDVFLYPSLPYGGWEEQFGYAMAEAALMELPVISTTSGSIDELVIDGVTGILVEPNNAKELAQAMTKLAKNPQLCEKMGRAGRQHIMVNFAHDKIAQKFYTFFRKIREVVQ